jgi:putative adhesin
MATHHTPNGVRLKVRVLSGRCEIETADTDDTVVEATPMNGSSASREAAEALVEELRELHGGGHELVVEVPKRKRLVPGFGDASVLIRVRGPHGLGLDASTASADVEVLGRLGDADVRTASGDVHIESAEGRAAVKTASGDVALGAMTGDTAVNTMSGDVRVQETATALNVNTMSGDVRIRRATGGTIQLRSMSGDLEAAIARGASLYVDATSASGDVRSELPVTGSAPDGGPADVELRATSLSGDIVVTRAEPVPTQAA